MHYLLAFFFILISVSSCKKPQERICDNLLHQGIADAGQLQGEWIFHSFAFTQKGKKVSQGGPSARGRLIFSNGEITGGVGRNGIAGAYSLSGSNLISMQIATISYAGVTEEEGQLLEALNNASCYTLVANELWIHYPEVEERNLLVFEKD